MLYKYRSLANLQFALDILVYQRMYAAMYKDLNDPMEGQYLYKSGQFTEAEVESIFAEKGACRILSLAEAPDNILMWSYYADSHAGIVLGISITDVDAEVRPMQYVDDLSIDDDRSDVAKKILSRKLKPWQHEKEYRAFTQNRSFVKIKVEKLIFGLNTNDDLKNLLTKITKAVCPDVEIGTMRRDELDKGDVMNSYAVHSRIA